MGQDMTSNAGLQGASHRPECGSLAAQRSYGAPCRPGWPLGCSCQKPRQLGVGARPVGPTHKRRTLPRSTATRTCQARGACDPAVGIADLRL
eukprot:6475407-Amphidinium_carterae.1